MPDAALSLVWRLLNTNTCTYLMAYEPTDSSVSYPLPSTHQQIAHQQDVVIVSSVPRRA